MRVIDNLKKFGPEFQLKCISGLISDKPFMERISDIVDPTSFETDAQQWIVRTALKYFLQYKELPTLTTFQLEVDAVTQEEFKRTINNQLSARYTKPTE